MINLFGWLGCFFLSVQGLPQAWMALTNGHTEGLSKWLVWLWFLGEIFSFPYVVATHVGLPIICNYLINGVAVSILLYYTHYPRKT